MIIQETEFYKITNNYLTCCGEVQFRYYCKACDEPMGCYFCTFDYNEKHEC